MQHKLISRVRSMFYAEDHWVVRTFWNSLFIAFFLMPLGINLPTPFFIVAMVFGIVMMFRDRKKFVLDVSLLLFPLYFVLMCLGLIYTNNLSSGLDLVQRSLSLLLFPMIFMSVKEDAATVRRLFDFLLVGLLLSFCINISLATQIFVTHISDQVPDMGLFPVLDEIAGEWYRFYMGSALSKWVNPNYISIYILLVLSFYLKSELKTRKQLIISVVLFGYLFLLASIAAYLILALMSVMLIFDIEDRQKKYTGTIIFFLGVLVLLGNPRIPSLYKLAKEFHSTTDKEVMSLGKAKILAWDTAIELIGEAPILGYGTGDANDVLLEKYKELDYGFNYSNGYNAHNQFLQTYLQLGITGFGILIAIFTVLALRLRRSYYEFSVFLILFASLLVESMLVRFNGIVFFSIVVPLLLKKRSILGGRIIRNTDDKIISLKP